MPSIQENKTNLIAKAKNTKQEDLINTSADAATIEACFTLIAMSRGTHEIQQHCQTSGCNKSVKTTFYCKSCQARGRARADARKHQYSTRSKARNI
ncbi:hypothetical protein H9Q69_002826 [Fusarium xylarioides]|uniref:Uncharacterized protein n=1 Tax=Fusarium xylarioides TaxID=221167 RepID=A0A9P7IU53_9HYPO|nr:hypothetical protein H9Q70_003392 [Fusarium xylarioides]KAG5759965.1 hypothetical protein H9Q72_011912 [Fusarium xylarioides]KAG5785607.1 hypothetical protein H9Q73_000783 [Fusarium xylarioides]KAG5798151.1 hypothetical protein H9Q69_002826 [Fusarium xylarioides]KAG5817250.1 hypothetical protein H9Q71_002010 [Fusarium xylarioides]